MSDLATYNQMIINECRAIGDETGDSFPLLLLTTTGAKSGKSHTAPLAYSRAADRLVVLASNGGRPLILTGSTTNWPTLS
jgi:F420H(2)-dependent quinone reductase